MQSSVDGMQRDAHTSGRVIYIPDDERETVTLPVTVGGRAVQVTTIGHCDHSEALLRILANGNLSEYISKLQKECSRNSGAKERGHTVGQAV